MPSKFKYFEVKFPNFTFIISTSPEDIFRKFFSKKFRIYMVTVNNIFINSISLIINKNFFYSMYRLHFLILYDILPLLLLKMNQNFLFENWYILLNFSSQKFCQLFYHELINLGYKYIKTYH